MESKLNVFSDYIVYADESGDHSLESIDPNYPIFVLCFCVFKKETYSSSIIQKINELKFKYFGHDNIILHSHEIRKRTHNFLFLNEKSIEKKFLTDVSDIIKKIDFKIISCVINKLELKNKYTTPDNPYHISLKFCIERLYKYLKSIDEKNLNSTTHIVFEARGKKEDDELELEFRRLIDSGTAFMAINANFKIHIADKKTNSTGLQIADLIAHPIGRHCLNKNQDNQAFRVVEDKLLRNENKDYNGLGIRYFP